MTIRLDYLLECLKAGAAYIPASLQMALIAFALATVIGFFIATVRFYKVPILSQLLAFFTTVLMGIPNVLALNVIYLFFTLTINDVAIALGLPFTIKDFNFRLVAYITIVSSVSIVLSEYFRGAYKAIDRTQFEAGYSIGMTKAKTLQRIIIPQIIPVVLPNMVNMLAGTVKNISLISAIGLMEVMGGCLIPCARTYSFLEGYIAAALIYWAIVAIIEQAGRLLEKRSSRFRRTVV